MTYLCGQMTVFGFKAGGKNAAMNETKRRGE